MFSLVLALVLWCDNRPPKACIYINKLQAEILCYRLDRINHSTTVLRKQIARERSFWLVMSLPAYSYYLELLNGE